MTHYKKLSLAVAATLSLSASHVLSDTWYESRQQGWFWHEPLPEEQEPAKEVPLTPPVVSQQQSNNSDKPKEESYLALNSAWLKENLEPLMLRAMDNPTPENIAAYAYANRLMMDLGTRFSSKMMEYMSQESPLQESARRPFSAFALDEFAKNRQGSLKTVLDAIKSESHIWFFYSSSCSFCLRQVPVLQELHKQYGIEILAISLDGGMLPGIENFNIVYDENQQVARQFNVSRTPTMHLVKNATEQVLPLGEGMHTLTELEDLILLVSRQNGIISDDQYAMTRAVREINVFRNDDGEILVDKQMLESNPAYLAEMLRKRLEDVTTFGTNQVMQNSTPLSN